MVEIKLPPSEREAFEEYVLTDPDGCDSNDLRRHEKGHYKCPITESHWHTWQKARAAVELNLTAAAQGCAGFQGKPVAGCKVCVGNGCEAAQAAQPVAQQGEGGVCGRCGGWVHDPVIPQDAHPAPVAQEVVDKCNREPGQWSQCQMEAIEAYLAIQKPADIAHIIRPWHKRMGTAAEPSVEDAMSWEIRDLRAALSRLTSKEPT